MENNKKILIIVGVVVLIVVLTIVLIMRKGGETEQQVSTLDSVDTVGDFYGKWLEAVKNPADADPSKATLANSPILSKTLRDRLVSAQGNPDISPDPVLCQTVLPEDVGIRSVYETVDGAQILVTSRDKNVTEQAVFTLLKHNDGWYINEIECSAGEIGIDREFSFENEGFILKDSLPAPYDTANWHLVFEQGGVMGHVVPIFFDAGSECKSQEGNKSVCAPAQFQEGLKVYVRGQMTERGLSVKFLDFIK